MYYKKAQTPYSVDKSKVELLILPTGFIFQEDTMVMDQIAKF